MFSNRRWVLRLVVSFIIKGVESCSANTFAIFYEAGERNSDEES